MVSGPGERSVHHHRVNRGRLQRVWTMDGDPVPGGPAVLWSNPFPCGLVRVPCTLLFLRTWICRGPAQQIERMIDYSYGVKVKYLRFSGT